MSVSNKCHLKLHVITQNYCKETYEILEMDYIIILIGVQTWYFEILFISSFLCIDQKSRFSNIYRNRELETNHNIVWLDSIPNHLDRHIYLEVSFAVNWTRRKLVHLFHLVASKIIGCNPVVNLKPSIVLCYSTYHIGHI